jgi:drug/metabolite transporter (DMT)-like permease
LLAPFSYCQIIISTIFGYLAFHAAPDGWSYLGALLIIASGVYNAHRTNTGA